MPDHSGPTADATGQSGGPPQRRRRGPLIFAWGVVIVVAGLVGYGAWGQAQRRTAALETLRQQENMVPHVRTAAVKVTDAPRMLNLPGNIEAFDSAIIYARATGYIAKRNVDIGSKVHAGDVLAVIAAPDLDQQLAQARAQLVQMQAAIGQAHANMELAQRTNARTVQMVQQGWQSKQQGDTDRFTYVAQDAALKVAEANYKAQKAEVSRLEKLTGFEKVVAPFNGVISQRQIDVGSLVTANVSSGTALFSIVRSDVLRIQVYVPQETALDVKDGQSAEVRVPEMPNRVFHGTVARNATALQPGTRTLLTEVDVNNSNETLLPGLYCTVQLAVPRRHPVITVPSQAVIFNKDGLSAAVDEDGMVRLRHLDVLADDGAEVEVRAGLNPTDRIILNPPIGVTDGMHVSSTNTPEEARAE